MHARLDAASWDYAAQCPAGIRQLVKGVRLAWDQDPQVDGSLEHAFLSEPVWPQHNCCIEPTHCGCTAGMGDVVSLVEKLQTGMEEDEARRMGERMMANKFDFNDFLKQIRFMSKLGGLTGLVKMMPGAALQLSGLQARVQCLVG